MSGLQEKCYKTYAQWQKIVVQMRNSETETSSNFMCVGE